MTPVRLSADAQADLEGIWLFVAQDSIAAADRLVEGLYAACERLVLSPRIGHSREDLTDADVLFWARGQLPDRLCRRRRAP